MPGKTMRRHRWPRGAGTVRLALEGGLMGPNRTLRAWLDRLFVMMALVAVLAVTSCGDHPSTPDSTDLRTFDFTAGFGGWTADVTHIYEWAPLARQAFVADWRPLPAPLDTSTSAVFLQGDAGGNDFNGPFLYVKKQIAGLRPDTTYQVTFSLDIATNTPSPCPSSVSLIPGAFTAIKAGASTVEPVSVLGSGDRYDLSVDMGSTFDSAGTHAVILGSLANTVVACSGPTTLVWQKKSLTGVASVSVKTASDGTLWILTGADAGNPAEASLYLLKLVATFTPG
jgi:hypothetical protein